MLVCLCGFCTLFIIPGTTAEKIATKLTIDILPENPAINQSFFVSGFLTTSTGQPLGNKRVTLESSPRRSQDPADFSFIAIKETDRDGKYGFFRPVDTPPEFLRVFFAGNDEYNPSESLSISVKGAGTNDPHTNLERTGSITVSTNPQEADIYIDGVMKGVTYKKVSGLTEGPHVLTLVKTGYQNQTEEAYITAARDAYFEITLMR